MPCWHRAGPCCNEVANSLALAKEPSQQFTEGKAVVVEPSGPQLCYELSSLKKKAIKKLPKSSQKALPDSLFARLLLCKQLEKVPNHRAVTRLNRRLTELHCGSAPWLCSGPQKRNLMLGQYRRYCSAIRVLSWFQLQLGSGHWAKKEPTTPQ